MYRKFTASRISESNVLFPPTIIFTDEGITIKTPALLHHNTDFIPYEAVSSVMIHTPLAGFSTITFYAYSRVNPRARLPPTRGAGEEGVGGGKVINTKANTAFRKAKAESCSRSLSPCYRLLQNSPLCF